MWVVGQYNTSADLPPGKEIRYPLYTAGLMGAENLASTGIRSPDRPSRSQSLYRLSYPGPHNFKHFLIKFF
jgi:hypothetical protein